MNSSLPKHAAAVLCLLACLAAPAARADAPSPVTVTAAPVPAFVPAAPQETRFGALRYIGGLILRSSDGRFGGISSMTIDSAGRAMVAITDTGDWITASLHYDGEIPAGLSDASMGPLLDADGQPLSPKENADAESLARLPDGDLIVGFERRHRILRFGRDFAAGTPARLFSQRPWMASLPANRGIEALAVIPGGGEVVALAERKLDAAGDHTGWILDASGRERGEFHVRRRGGFDITDAAFLPDGSLLLLERYFAAPIHLEIAIRRIAPGEVRPGARIDGEVILQADRSAMIDNMEAIAVHEGASGRPVITIVSDDNFNFLQRTLLLQFELMR